MARFWIYFEGRAGRISSCGVCERRERKKKNYKDDFKVWSLSHWKARDKTVA